MANARTFALDMRREVDREIFAGVDAATYPVGRIRNTHALPSALNTCLESSASINWLTHAPHHTAVINWGNTSASDGR